MTEEKASKGLLPLFTRDSMKVLAIVHVYYHSMWEELEHCLLNIAAEDDLTLFLTFAQKNPELAKRIAELFPNCRIEVVANRGYDIWPFLYMLQQADLDDFDLLVKLHTKRDMYNGHGMKGVWTPGPVWRENLLAFCRTRENWKTAKRQFSRPRVGMISHELNCYSRKHDSCEFHYPEIEKILARMGFDMPPKGRFVAGAMFAARPKLLKSFCGLYGEEDFPVPDENHTEGLPHQLERAFGFAAYAQGYRVASYNGKILWLQEFFRKIKKFFFYRQRTSTHIRLRILGIPVMQRRHKDKS